jgi:60 kDa SS-A/Ro ribonucleoprotein
MPPASRSGPKSGAQASKVVVNNAGGVGAYAVSDVTRLRRFLILGSEGGTFYASERKLTLECAAAIARMIETGRGAEVVAEVSVP